MGRILDLYCSLLKVVIALLLAMMVVLVFSNVALRYLFDSGIGATDELSRWMLVWMTFLGAIVGLRQRAHLGVDTLLHALPPGGRKLFMIISYALMLFVSFLLIYGSWKLTLLNVKVEASGTGLPVALFYGIGVAFGLSAAIILAYDLYRLLTGRMTDAELMGMTAGETH